MIKKFLIGPKVLSGAGSLNLIGEEAQNFRATKVLIVTDPGVHATGIPDKVSMALTKAGIHNLIFDEVESDPSSQTAEKARRIIRENDVDLVVAVGGGSPIDAAKSAAMLVTNGGNLINYKGVGKVSIDPIPLFAIPTTAGTGSEMTSFAVMCDNSMNEKFSLNSDRIIPKLAILDPELTVGLPPMLTATTGMDALGHAIESFSSNIAQPATDALAVQAIKMIFENLRTAVFRGDNLSARENMLQASMLAGAAFNITFLGVCHAIAPAIGGMYHIPHGLAVAALTPHCMRFNLPAAMDKYAEIAIAIGVGMRGEQKVVLANKAIDEVQSLCDDFRIPHHLRDLGVRNDEFDSIADFVVPHVQTKNNPRIPSHKEIVELMEIMY